MANFGFIISRHVNSEKTNKYWNECVRCIQRVHQGIKIVIIDDNSNYDFVKPFKEYENIEIVQSEYPGRGELLPYYYFWKNHYWENAVIMHDSVFIQNRIPYRKLRTNVLPLWHFNGGAKMENSLNSLRISRNLKNSSEIRRNIYRDNHDATSIMKIKNKNNNNNWNGVFGVQSYINWDFLSRIQQKYEIFNMLNCVTNRPDRCCLERIMGVIFWLEDPTVRVIPSIFGDIMRSPDAYVLNFDGYCEHLRNNGRAKTAYVKIWSGR
jgi:hypothetical protein